MGLYKYKLQFAANELKACLAFATHQENCILPRRLFNSAGKYRPLVSFFPENFLDQKRKDKSFEDGVQVCVSFFYTIFP